jgi:hypothetical protein
VLNWLRKAWPSVYKFFASRNPVNWVKMDDQFFGRLTALAAPAAQPEAAPAAQREAVPAAQPEAAPVAQPEADSSSLSGLNETATILQSQQSFSGLGITADIIAVPEERYTTPDPVVPPRERPVGDIEQPVLEPNSPQEAPNDALAIIHGTPPPEPSLPTSSLDSEPHEQQLSGSGPKEEASLPGLDVTANDLVPAQNAESGKKPKRSSAGSRHALFSSIVIHPRKYPSSEEEWDGVFPIDREGQPTECSLDDSFIIKPQDKARSGSSSLDDSEDEAASGDLHFG